MVTKYLWQNHKPELTCLVYQCKEYRLEESVYYSTVLIIIVFEQLTHQISMHFKLLIFFLFRSFQILGVYYLINFKSNLSCLAPIHWFPSEVSLLISGIRSKSTFLGIIPCKPVHWACLTWTSSHIWQSSNHARGHYHLATMPANFIMHLACTFLISRCQLILF